MLVALAVLAILAVLVWVGRKPARLTSGGRLLTVVFSAVAAVAAVVSALLGGWIPSLVLIVLSVFMGQVARRAAPPDSPADGGMSLADARSILGVDANAGPPEINAAYRRLMTRAHPDQGGSVGLAAQLNRARDRLLKG